jgi:molybdopterin-guanine dinucleotide biosynthesis protein MobB
MNQNNPPILSIVGRKQSGKTKLIIDIIEFLIGKGYRIAAVRHSPHHHCLDSAGSDTDRFQKAGAQGSGLITADEINLFLPAATWKAKAIHITRAFQDCHLILMEGGVKNAREKIEVVPEGENPLCEGDPGMRAVVGRDCSANGMQSFAADEIERICSFIEKRYLRPALSAAVQAGGRSRRLGRNKALLQINESTVIEQVLKTVSRFCSHVKIVTNSPDEYKHLGLETTTDIRPGGGPLSGIHTALSLSPTEYVLVVSCDIPLIGPEHIELLLSAYPGSDITLYKHKNFEPLCAIYRRTCIDALEELIDHQEYRIIDLFPTLKVKVIRIDNGAVFRSINTEEDYKYLSEKFSQ